MANKNESIGDRIRAARLKMGISQRELGRRAGLGFTGVCQAESGKYDLRSRNLHAISIELGVSMEFLMTGKNIEK